MGLRDAAAISLARVGLVSMTFGNAYSFAYSLAGAALSLAVMALLRPAVGLPHRRLPVGDLQHVVGRPAAHGDGAVLPQGVAALLLAVHGDHRPAALVPGPQAQPQGQGRR